MDEEELLNRRDDEIDSYLTSVEEDVRMVFGRLLSGVSDDPRDITWDILFLALMDSGLRSVVGRMPWGARARTAAAIAVDVSEDSTRGLDAARELLVGDIESRIRTLVQDRLVSLSTRMRLEGATGGFVAAAAEQVDRLVKDVVDALSNALLAWERTVLERIAPEDAVYYYAGPVDKRNREFCAAIAPMKVARTRAAIDALNAHPLLHWYVPPNVFTYCGGINCRHLWVPMTRASAAARGLEVLGAV